MDNFDIVIVTNGAGELSAWVRPTVRKLTEAAPDARIILVITPCQYATGRELEIAKQIKGVHRIVTPKEYVKWLLLFTPPKDLKFSTKGIVVFMGGDLFHGKILSRRLKFPAIAYLEKYTYNGRSYKKFMVPDEQTYNRLKRKKLEESKLIIVGDLMVDGVLSHLSNSSRERVLSKWELSPGRKIISFLPGSRTWQIRLTLPYYLHSVKKIRERYPVAQIAMILSPYLTLNKLERTIKRYVKGAKIVKKVNGLQYLSKDNMEILIVDSDQHDFIANSTLAVTIPGTNTAEISVLGTPMLTFFPFNRIDIFPVEGVLGWICRLPIIGFYIMVIYGRMLGYRTKFFAIPNKKTGREIVPELRGLLKPEDVAEKIIYLLEDQGKLEKMRAELKTAMGQPGASGEVAAEILKAAEKA